MIDPEAESAAVRERSAELAGLLAVLPVVERASPAVLAERRRLARATHEARRTAAAKVAAGLPAGAGVVVGAQPPVRRVVTDWKGVDRDPFHGSPCVTPELVAFFEHQRDHVAAEVAGQYRRAAEATPYREALVAAARQHVEVLRGRRTMLSEGGSEVEAALTAYEQAYVNLREAAIDAQFVAGEAQQRLDTLHRIVVQVELGDALDERPFIANAIASAAPDTPIVFDAKSGDPLVPAAGAVT
jgi:hypothetical protein